MELFFCLAESVCLCDGLAKALIEIAMEICMLPHEVVVGDFVGSEESTTLESEYCELSFKKSTLYAGVRLLGRRVILPGHQGYPMILAHTIYFNPNSSSPSSTSLGSSI